ncbi:L-threonylcarbamoyladenylate synthase [Rhizobium sp. NRK18]|uniref:L-threonylcarbamoyladenylate synthase n=1 Tax=Rhizobium sp. NRK18 TaxID=2964667 RepID=UPI0021C3B37E|nr:L-threonylcarbamoyladenylate synthase [Rhizobium sp. NRK18]MCQ2005120.1 L-threonylcarbamoyladenylate synthase [Rhizobium sp. NRK18]
MARIIDITKNPDEAIAAALPLLEAGKPIAMPTETVYGLAADATNPAAVTAIYETKGRPRFNPLICHMADKAMAERYATFDPVSAQLADRFWPGPLTLILPLKEGSGIHPLATAGLETVGVRVPRGFSATLIKAFDRPLAAPSANTSGKISPTTAAHVDQDLGERIDLILDGGPAKVGLESTIVKVDGDVIRLLRPGGISADEIAAATGLEVVRHDGTNAEIEAPGMLVSHYAPGASMRLMADMLLPGEALLTFGGKRLPGIEYALGIFDLSPSGDLAEAAASLFGMMKDADATGAKTIAVTAIPSHGLGEAINDRLARAAAPRTPETTGQKHDDQ